MFTSCLSCTGFVIYYYDRLVVSAQAGLSAVIASRVYTMTDERETKEPVNRWSTKKLMLDAQNSTTE